MLYDSMKKNNSFALTICLGFWIRHSFSFEWLCDIVKLLYCNSIFINDCSKHLNTFRLTVKLAMMIAISFSNSIKLQVIAGGLLGTVTAVIGHLIIVAISQTWYSLLIPVAASSLGLNLSWCLRTELLMMNG